MHSNHPEDRPKLLGDPVAREHRRMQLSEPHVAPLTTFVRCLRGEAGPGADIPDFDPWDGGVLAQVLFLLEAPGAKAVSSGFISRNNPDETAKNFFELNEAAAIPRSRPVIWNVVPWYIGLATRIRGADSQDIAAGIRHLPRLLGLLPQLRAVVFLGRKAERAGAIVIKARPDLHIFTSPHPSPLVVNRAPGNRQRILSVLREVAAFLDSGVPAV